jgi:iron(II)-dependent oxidoreductase
MRLCLVAFCGVFWLAGGAAAGDPGYTIAPIGQAPGVAQEEAEAFYQEIVRECGAMQGVRVVERKLLKVVLDERDLALAENPKKVNRAYASSAAGLSAEWVLVPAITKVEADFLLSLRLISVREGSLQACAVRKTRLTSKFGEQAKALAGEVLAKPMATLPDGGKPVLPASAVEDARAQCRAIGAPKLFPAFWERCERLREKTDSPVAAELVDYYAALIRLCAWASHPPEAMSFVPGGWVNVGTSAGQRRLWVEPFFMDRHEVTAGEYSAFVQHVREKETGPARLRALTPITAGNAAFDGAALPVTGVSWDAANAFASWQGKRLPTLLQWLRAACGDDGRIYPCGPADSLKRCNLKGPEDGYAVLAPAAEPGQDVGPFGLLGLTGNVREWTASWFALDAYARTETDAPQEPQAGTMKIVKGGGWRTNAPTATCALTEKYRPAEALDDVGFRCVVPFFRGGSAGTSEDPKAPGN